MIADEQLPALGLLLPCVTGISLSSVLYILKREKKLAWLKEKKKKSMQVLHENLIFFLQLSILVMR